MDDLSLEIGFQLIPLVDEKQGGQMLHRVRALRRHLATELGFIVPPVHITDNLRLKPREYHVVPARRGDCPLADGGQLVCWPSMPIPRRVPLPGMETREPAFGVSCALDSAGL